VIAAELFHFGRLTSETARLIALEAMPQFRTGTGEFLAWRTQGIVPNPVDLGLNTNVAAFLAQTGCSDSAPYRASCRAICDRVASCDSHPRLLDELVPYYPEPSEFFLALENAVRRGARELLPALTALQPYSLIGRTDGTKILFANEG